MAGASMGSASPRTSELGFEVRTRGARSILLAPIHWRTASLIRTRRAGCNGISRAREMYEQPEHGHRPDDHGARGQVRDNGHGETSGIAADRERITQGKLSIGGGPISGDRR